MAMTFRVELVWTGQEGAEHKDAAPSSIYLTKDGRIVLQGRPVSPEERAALDLPADVALISVDRALVEAQDKDLGVPQSREAVARRFELSVQEVRQIEREGLDASWPPL